MKHHVRWITALAAAAIPLLATASSHREAPNITALSDRRFHRLLHVHELRGRPRTLRHAARQTTSRSGSYTAGRTILRSIRLRCTRSTSTTTAMRAEDLTFQFRFTNTLANGNQGIKLNIGPNGSQQAVAVPLKNVGTGERGAAMRRSISASLTRSPWCGAIGAMNRPHRSPMSRTVAAARSASRMTTSAPRPSEMRTPTRHTRAASFTTSTSRAARARGRVFVGQRDEPFAVNLGNVVRPRSTSFRSKAISAPGAGDGKGFPGGITQDRTNDTISRQEHHDARRWKFRPPAWRAAATA